MKTINTACIIDDDHIFVFGMKHMIQITKFCKTAIYFNNGKEAIDGLKSILKNDKNIPDVILLDINMPIMDGWQFLDEFEKTNQNISTKVFIISSSINPIDIAKAKTYKTVVDFIIKPISIEKIEEISEIFAIL